MKLIFYFFVGTYTQYVLGDPEITHIKPPKPLSIKDVLRYVTDTSKVLEELAKEHLWLLSRMTGTNNWKDLLGKEQEGVVDESPQSEEGGEGDETESPEPQKEETVDEKESPQPQEEETRDEKESPQPEEGGEDGESQGEGEVENEEKQAVVEEETSQPVGVQTMTEIEGISPAEDDAIDNQNIDAGIIDRIETMLQEITNPTIKDKSHTLHSHPQHDRSHDNHHPQTTTHKPESNQNVGYSTDIGHGNSPDPTLNYLAWKDKPIQHHVDAYGKPVRESEKLQKGLDVTKPVSSVSPRVQSTQEHDVVFSPLPINKPEVTTTGKNKPIPNKMPTSTKDGDKITKQPNPLARLHNNHPAKPETNTLPNGVFNPLAIDSFDALNDIDNVMDEILAGSSARSTMNNFQPDEPVHLDPLDYPVQYYEPESVPNTHSTHHHHHQHPAHHSRLEDYDSGWW